MNLFSKIFGDSDNKDSHESSIHWNALTELLQLDQIVQESTEQLVFVFKHSTRCNISRMALRQFEHHYSIEESDAKGYFLDLLEHRNISNEIADRFSVIHQSPQLILLSAGKCVYTVSHSDIDADELKIKVGEHQ